MRTTEYDVVIIGAGPAGIFTALELMELKSALRVLIVDSGRRLDQRGCPARTSGRCVNCQPCAIMNGWAGAGAFSDGKLSLSDDVGGHLPDYVGHERAQELIRYVDGIYCAFGAPDQVHGLNTRKVDELIYEASLHNIQLVPCPVRHMGTDRSVKVLGGMYEALVKNANFEFSPLTEAQELLIEDGRVTGLLVKTPRGAERIATPVVVAAPGRSGAEWLSQTARQAGIGQRNNAVDIGVRVEVPNAVMDRLTEHLYEAKLVYYSDTFENRVRTFCMNPSGLVSEEHYEGGIAVVNGHSYSEAERKTQNTNFAMLVSTRFTEPFNQPIAYGKYIAQLGNMLTGGGVMVQRLGDLLQGRRTNAERLERSTTRPTLRTAVPGDLSFVLPQRHLTSIVEALRAFDKLAPGLYSKNTLLYGVEVKFYSSKIDVDSSFQTAVGGFYAIGDGAGVTRGLIQASATGVVVARDIQARLKG